MAEIRPFRGVRYNEQLVSDLSAVICPPYDIITPQTAQELYQRSEYNFARLEYGRLLPPGTSPEEKHTHSATTLDEWLGRGVLKIDEVPALYLHDHSFSYRGKEYRRRGILASVRLEEWDKMVIRPHEGTLARAKDDRLSLLWTLEANTSPILTLFDDGGGRVSSLLTLEAQKQPVISLVSDTGDSHSVWAITEPEVTKQIGASLAHQPLYIADGHHRYESALTYQRERRACSGAASGDEEFNFVMMTLVALSDPGLIILSPHRLVRGLSPAILSELKAKLASFFELEELPLSDPDVWQQVDALIDSQETDQTRFILVGLSPEHLVVLRLRDPGAVRQMIPYFHGELYSKLNVSILDHVILEEMLGLGSGQENSLTFSYDRQEAVRKIVDREYQLAFLLSPVKAELVKAIADGGERMPRKSTYFYPKPPAGLVFRRLD
ncbi:MAG TPA: DUF1015 domain-containing protein [Dehalococcoidia bacterium]|nr:DUF1015 domain-containing protein [Dehalococcoidia bacterium]